MAVSSGTDRAVNLLSALVTSEVGSGGVSGRLRCSERLLGVVGSGWSSRHWIGRSREYSKTDDLAAVSLVAVLEQLKPSQEALAVRGSRSGALLIDQIRRIALSTPELAKQLIWRV